MPRVEFKPTISAFERAKIVHALDRAATVVGSAKIYPKERICHPITVKISIFLCVTNINWKIISPTYLSIYVSIALCWTLAAFSVSWSLYTVSWTPWMGDQPFARPLPAHRIAQIQNKRTQTSMPQVGFEPTIPVFERAKTVYALDRAATVVGKPDLMKPSIVYEKCDRRFYSIYYHNNRDGGLLKGCTNYLLPAARYT
jgi:hypothetical protein